MFCQFLNSHNSYFPTQDNVKFFFDRKDNVNFELEKLRIKLGHMKGVCKLVQDESTSASQQVSLEVVFLNTSS